MPTLRLKIGDCVDRMSELPDGSVRAVVSDPPYGLRFMGKEFDDLGEGSSQREWHRGWVNQAFRVIRPGGVIKAFGGTRTFHHLAAVMREAGFTDIRIGSYGSGFPKSLSIGKAIDKAEGAERTDRFPYVAPDGKPRPTVVSDWAYSDSAGKAGGLNRREAVVSIPATDAARTWEGWGTALKPAWEPVVVGRKPE